MQNFTTHGQGIINDLASRYGLSNDAVICMLFAVSNGGGTMAQFNCPELGGGGQWMSGGMTMVGDMFNHGLKNTVDNLCSEISNALANANEPIFVPVKRAQPSNAMGANSLFIPGNGSGNWWPDELNLGIASSMGGQNNVRYAVFPQSCRLAVEINGAVTVYDTLDNQIGGVSQQQGGDSSFTFTSQYGLVQVGQLPVVWQDGYVQSHVAEQSPAFSEPIVQQEDMQEQINQVDAPSVSSNQGLDEVDEHDIFNKIERLAALHKKGILTDGEFGEKKSELLKRL